MNRGREEEEENKHTLHMVYIEFPDNYGHNRNTDSHIGCFQIKKTIYGIRIFSYV